MRRTERPARRTIPVNMIIGDRPALVAGGGQVGMRKVRSLLEAGARAVLVCPEATGPFPDELRDNPRLEWIRREYRSGDAAGKMLVFACTDDKHANRAILDDARANHVPCCCSDMNWPDGDFTTPAVARMGDLLLAVSTSGQSCRSARDVRNELAAYLGERSEPRLAVYGTSEACLSSRRRAPLHLPAAERNALGALLGRVRGVSEFMILNTCNRVELAVMAPPDPQVEALLLRLTGFDRLAAGERFSLQGFEAFRHLVLVCAGLDSPLLGESHVSSQMKEAFSEAAEKKWSGPALASAEAEILRVAKAVRAATGEYLRVAEIDQIAVRYLSVHGGLDNDAHVAVIGTGMVGTGAVRALCAAGASVDWFYHRRVPDAAEAGPDAAGRVSVKPLADLPSALSGADIVVSAVDSSKPVVLPEMSAALAGRNVLMVDLGVPRNIDPFYDDFGHGVTVATLDDLKLWHRVKSGVLKTVMAVADETIRREYRPQR